MAQLCNATESTSCCHLATWWQIILLQHMHSLTKLHTQNERKRPTSSQSALQSQFLLTKAAACCRPWSHVSCPDHMSAALTVFTDPLIWAALTVFTDPLIWAALTVFTDPLIWAALTVFTDPLIWAALTIFTDPLIWAALTIFVDSHLRCLDHWYNFINCCHSFPSPTQHLAHSKTQKFSIQQFQNDWF